MATSAWRQLAVTLLRIALLAVAYAAVGVPALQLSTPPGYAAPIFPPAGIMLAAGLIYGYRVLPAAFFGSLLMRLVAYGGLSAGQPGLQWVGIVIALAATLQAAVGTRLARRLCGDAPALDTPATIVRFVLLSPVVALVSASISAPALLKWGIAVPSSGFFYWWNWWIGDTLGILVGVPVTLALLGRPREHWQARRWTVAVPLLAMIALAALLSGMIARWEDQRIEGRFAFDAQKLVNAFRSELRLDVLAVQAAAHGGAPLNDGAAPPRWLQEASSIHSIGRVWVTERPGAPPLPRVEDASGQRDEDVRVLGLATVQSALQQALASGQVAASEPWTIASGPGEQAEFVVWIPDDGSAPGAGRRSLVYAVLNVNRLDPRLLVGDPGGLAICWVDRTGGGAAHLIAGRLDCERPVRGKALKQETAIPLWGRDWLIRVVATPGYIGTMHGWSTWAFSAVAVLAIGATGVFLLLLTGRAQTISRLVLYRTTELEREKAALRSSEELLRNILDHASVGITVYGPDGRLLRVNPSLCQITGYRAEELVGMRCTDLIHPDDRTADDAWPRERARPAGAGPDEGRELRYVRKDGSPVHVQVRVALGSQRHGEPDYAVAVIEDITGRVRLREAERARLIAEEATRAKDDFLSRMSHELRTPLNGILGFAQILLSDAASPLPERQRRQVEHVETAGWHLLAIIDDLLDLSRIEAGAIRLSLEPVDLELVVAETVAMVSGAASKQGIEVRVRIESDARRVRADATRLKQVLANLASNALKYNTRGGTVTVEARSAGPEQVVVTVRDTGQGMSPGQLSELFQPFNRLGRDAGPVPGTGIGLVVTKKLIELMGGRIDVSSVEGQGSVFAVTLAAAHADPVARPPAGELHDGGARYGRKRVAYIEDNPLNAEVMRALLSARPQVGLDVYARAEDGLAAIRAQAFDLLLLDMSLPDARGIDVLRRLKDDAATKPMPVIVVSADTLADHVREALRAGAVAYIGKPIERAQALETIDRALETVAA
jgi:PAS domain S-box-containing protein